MSPIRKSLWKFFREEGVRAAGKTPVFGLLKRGGKKDTSLEPYILLLTPHFSGSGFDLQDLG